MTQAATGRSPNLEAAAIVGIGKEHAYKLASQDRFPVLGTTGINSDRESLRVLIPRLVDWMYAGGTRQYDARPTERVSSATKPGRTGKQDPDLAWLAAELRSVA